MNEADANNPYSPPSSDPVVAAAGEIHQQGDQLVIPIGSELPDVCLFTGKRSTGLYLDKKLVWASPWIYLLIFVHILILIIVYLIVRKQGRLKYYIDGELRARSRKRALIMWLIFGGLIAATIIGIANNQGLLAVFSIMAALVLGLVAIFAFPRLKIAKIDKEFIYLKKVHADALQVILSMPNAEK